MTLPKRRIFNELIEGITAMKKHRTGKLKLRNYKINPTPTKLPKPKAGSHRISPTREKPAL